MEKGEKLLTLIHRKHFTVGEIADALNMTRSTFYRKSKNPRASFTIDQAFKMENLLVMNKEDFQSIFF